MLPEGDRVDNDTLANVTRMARSDPSQATAYLMAQSGGLSKEEQGAGWGVIGQYAAKKQTPDALDAYRRQMTLGGDAWLSDDSQEWRVRTALRAGDWKMVRQAIDSMRAPLRSRDPAWTYWYGRALKADGRNEDAKQQFQSIAGQFNFYGQLALEELGQRITVPQRTAVTDAEIDPMGRNHPGFGRAKRLYDLNLRFEGNREWNWELRNMSDRELLAAAEYGRKLGMLDRTVNSADKTRNEHDFSLRFPMPFRNVVERNADAVGLDVAWTYGLIRQESRFIMDARSSVGASGLMQVMPETAKRVAKKIGLPAFRPSQMSDIDTNVLLGTSYLSMILTDLDSSMTLATAGYNAGPGRQALALHADAPGGRRDLRRDHPLQRDPHLREERAVERHLLRCPADRPAAIAERPPGQGRARGRDAGRSAVGRTAIASPRPHLLRAFFCPRTDAPWRSRGA